MSVGDGSVRGSAAGTKRWLFRRGSLPLLTAVAATLALGLQLAGLLHDPPSPPSPDGRAATGDADAAAAASTAAHPAPSALGPARRTLHPPAPLRRAAAAPGEGPDARVSAREPATRPSDARRAGPPHGYDLPGAPGPEPAAGPDRPVEPPAAAALPEPPGVAFAGAATPAGDAGDGPGSGAAVSATPACPTSVEGLEDVAADLVARRARFDAREMTLVLRAAALEEAERRLAQRAAELEQLADELQARSGQLDAAQAARIARLVKVYEAMKPKQAAEVFDRLPLDLAVGVAAGMREVKVAAVLAAMSPDRAQRLTTELARLRRPPAEPIQATSR